MIYNKHIIKTITLGVHDFILAVLKQDINVHRYKLRSKVQDHDFMSHWKFGSNLLLGSNLLSSTKQWVYIIEGPVQSLKGIVQPDCTSQIWPGVSIHRILSAWCHYVYCVHGYWKHKQLLERDDHFPEIFYVLQELLKSLYNFKQSWITFWCFSKTL